MSAGPWGTVAQQIARPSARPVAHLGRRYHLSAAHRLHAQSLSDDVNRETYGKCNNPHGHGHNYVVEVSFAGPVDENGMVLDLGALDEFARAEMLARFDHANLNVLEEFRGKVPTTENFAEALFAIFRRFETKGLSAARLTRVLVEETGNNSFEICDVPASVAGRG